MKKYLGVIALGGLVLAAWLSTAFYTVHQTQLALVIQFGNPLATVPEPGLHMKAPWPIQNVHYLDKRVLNLDLPEEEVIAQDLKRLVVDAYARFQITDPLRFYQTLIDPDTARLRLQPILGSNVRRVLGSETFAAVLSDERAELMRSIRDGMNAETASFGINILDVRIRRADLPAENSAAIYSRMQQERVREAAEFRAQGEQISQEIRSRADREVTVIRAEATRESEILRGDGDALRNRIFADAFSQNEEFFQFYRSMRAYEGSLNGDNTTIVLSPDSDFFQYFDNAQ
jgi:membrane protease subunit HflC